MISRFRDSMLRFCLSRQKLSKIQLLSQEAGTRRNQSTNACGRAPHVMTMAAAQSCRIAVGQMTSTGDQQANFDVCRRLAEDAVKSGCGTLFLPEACSFIGENAEQTVAAATPLDGDAPVIGWYRDLARRLGIWLSIGGFQETSEDPGRLYNTHILLNGSGDLLACYRKIHLFDVDVHDGPILMESRSTAPGSSRVPLSCQLRGSLQVVVCDAPCGRVGLGVCYDLRFPWLSDAQRFEHGCDVLTYPSAFTQKTGEAHWELLLRARAVETQCYVVAAAQAGWHNSKRQSYGHAMVVDPWGEVVAKLDHPLVTGIAVANIDAERLRVVRERMPVDRHRTAARTRCGRGPV